MSSQSSSQSSLEDVMQTLGGYFMGFVFTIILYGFTFFQTYIYFTRYPKDGLGIKLTVGILCAVDTAASALISQTAYFYFIEQFLTPIEQLDAIPTFCIQNVLNVLAATIVQIFYSLRIYEVNGRSSIVPFFTSTVSLIAFGFGIAMTVQIFHQKRLVVAASSAMKVVAGLSQGLAALADIIIVVALCYAMRPSHNPRMKIPDGRFDKYVTIFINRGVCFTIIQLAYMCVFVAMPAKQFWIPFQMIVSKIYINSLLLLLNSRELVHGRGVNEEQSMSSARKSSAGMSSTTGTRSGAPIRFNVEDSKVQPSLSIGVSRTVEIDTNHDGDPSKVQFDDVHSTHEYLDDNSRKKSGLISDSA